jgi:hypothetical protein
MLWRRGSCWQAIPRRRLRRVETPTSENTLSTTGKGAAVQNYYFTRSMNFFPVTDSEMDSFGSLNMEANICLAVGIGLISLAGGIAITHAFTEKTSAAENILCYFGAPLLIVLGMVALWACRKFTQRRDRLWAKVVASSIVVPPTPPMA